MGSLKKVFILHGWTSSTEKWQPFIKFIKVAGVNPILLNIPGLTQKTNKIWSLDDYAEWLRKKLDQEKEKPVIVGHSNGGRIAIDFAVKYPEKLKHLVLIDSAGIYHNEFPIRLKRFVFRAIAKMGKKITSSKKLRDLLYKVAREADYKNANAQMRKTMICLISTDLTPQLSKITAPTLIIWGDLDKSTPLSDGKLMHKLIKNSKLYTIKGARHSPHYTHPKKVLRKILSEIGEQNYERL
jgi:pimeloyl-ACP methyl ester carboxylesterase